MTCSDNLLPDQALGPGERRRWSAGFRKFKIVSKNVDDFTRRVKTSWSPNPTDPSQPKLRGVGLPHPASRSNSTSITWEVRAFPSRLTSPRPFPLEMTSNDPRDQNCRRPPGDFKLHGIYDRPLLDGKSLYTNDPASPADSSYKSSSKDHSGR